MNSANVQSMPAANVADPGKMQSIQVLRGVAALLVIWCHLKYDLGLKLWIVYPFLATDIGAIGVDIFFVISGYVIAMTAAKCGRDWKGFLANRIARIVPLYFSVSLLCLALDILPGGRIASFQQIFNTFGFIPIFDRAHFTSPLCMTGWTISFEMWFYILFASLESPRRWI